MERALHRSPRAFSAVLGSSISDRPEVGLIFILQSGRSFQKRSGGLSLGQRPTAIKLSLEALGTRATPKIPMRVYPKGSAGFQPAAFGILPEASARAECNPTPSPARRQDADRCGQDARAPLRIDAPPVIQLFIMRGGRKPTRKVRRGGTPRPAPGTGALPGTRVPTRSAAKMPLARAPTPTREGACAGSKLARLELPTQRRNGVSLSSRT